MVEERVLLAPLRIGPKRAQDLQEVVGKQERQRQADGGARTVEAGGYGQAEARKGAPQQDAVEPHQRKAGEVQLPGESLRDRADGHSGEQRGDEQRHHGERCDQLC